MASPAVQPTIVPPPAPLPVLEAAGRTVFGGLLWGGVLLIVLALWLGYKTAEGRMPLLPWVVGVLGAAALALMLWHALTLWLQKLPPELKASELARQRRATGIALLGGGAVLLVIAGVLASIQIGSSGGSGTASALRSNFGEAVGLLMFSLVAIGAGMALLNPPRDAFAAVDLEPVRNLFPLIRVALFLAGIVLVGTFVVLAFVQRVGMAYFPELSGLLLFSMLCLAVGLWLTTIPVPDAFTTRIFVLTFGGFTGLILFILSLGRTYVWRSVVFGGLSVWQGEDAWQAWLCLYLQLFALALMFGSLLLARSDIRSNVILRRVLFGYKTVLDGLLLVEMLVIVNIAFYNLYPYTYDWSQERGLHALSESSKNLLHELKQPTQAYMLMSQETIVYNETRNLLDNMQAESNQFKWKPVSPDGNALDYEGLAQKFPEILPSGQKMMMGDDSGRGILLVYGEIPKDEKQKVPYTFIPERKLFDQQPGGMPGSKPKRIYKGEVELAKELNFLVHGKEKRKIYFLQGNDELDFTMMEPVRRVDPRDELSLYGCAMLVDKLKKDNYDVQAMTFSKLFAAERKKGKEEILYVGEVGAGKKPEVPKDAYAVVIAGASSTIPPEALNALENYANGGGRLLVLFDVVLTNDLKAMKFSGLEDLVKKYGIESADEFALRVIDRPGVDPFRIIATAPLKSDNALAKQFHRAGLDFRTVRVVRPGAAPGKYKAAIVMNSIPQLSPAVAVKDVSVLKDPIRYLVDLQDQGVLQERASSPLPLVVAISEEDKGRMVVFGDSEFISNLGLATDRTEKNYSLFVSALEWMADRDAAFIGPRPKTTESFALEKTVAAEYSRIHLVPMWLMLLTVVALGTGIWLVRRR